MELSGRPLFDNPLDAALFVDRDEAVRVERNCREGVNTLLVGGRGMGKTSLVRHVLFRLRESGFPAVGVDAGPAEDLIDLLRLIAAALGRPPRPSPLDPASLALGETGKVLREVRNLASSPGGSDARTAILVDLPEEKRGLHQLFGRFRDELWQLPFTWVISAPKEQRVELMTPPANAFFEDVVALEDLTPAQQERLVGLRLEPDERTPWRLPHDGEGNPRRLLELVRESVRSGESPERRFEVWSEQEAAAARLGESALVLYEQLRDNGPASASDRDLLDRLGWSRQRAAKVFSQLEARGLVSSELRSVSGGRPRKVYLLEQHRDR